MQIGHPDLAIGNAISNHFCVGIEGWIRRSRWRRRLRLGARQILFFGETQIRRCGNILKSPIHRGRMRQLAKKLFRTLDVSFAPHDLFHCLFRLDPRSRGLAPAARRGHRHLQPQPISLGCGVSKCVLPFRRHPDQSFADKLRRAEIAIEHLHSRDTNSFHPFRIGRDAFFGHVAIHPMPPDTRLCGIRRILETVFQRMGRGLCR